MKAISVTNARTLEVRDIPTPQQPAPGHVLIDMAASAINHGDKAFLKMPNAAGTPLSLGRYDVWGASGAGTVVAVGDGVPAAYAGRQVAVYRSLGRTPDSVGLWCERAHVPYTTCVILPDHVRAIDYSGALVNVMTAYAYLEEAIDAGHKGIIATAGNSATGKALARLARERHVPVIALVRTEAARDELRSQGVEHVIVTSGDYTGALSKLAAELQATAVFDGVGGDLLTAIAPLLPMNSTISLYGFLGGFAPAAIPSVVFMMKNLTMKRFSNFESPTVKQQDKLVHALAELAKVIGDPMFRTATGASFQYDAVDAAMDYLSADGAKAILIPG